MAVPLLAARSTIKTHVQQNLIELVLLALTVLLTVWLVSPVIMLMMGQATDYGIHAGFVQRLLNGEPASEILSHIPHFLYHLLVIITFRLIPSVTVILAAYYVALALYALLVVVIYWLIRTFLGKPANWHAGIVYVCGAAILMLVGPVNLFTPGNLYFGYTPSHIYHSPTMVTLKPLALLLFWLAGKGIERRPVTGGLLASYVSVTVLSIMAKPSYIMALLPALVGMALYRRVRGREVNWLLLGAGIVLPAVVLLWLQSLLYDVTGIAFAPLEFFNALGTDGLLFKFAMSILFPAFVYVAYYRKAREHFHLNLAWLTFAVGVSFVYLFVQRGEKLVDGNLAWTGQITLLVLFVMSFIFLLEQNRFLIQPGVAFRLTPQLVLASVTLGLHLWGGIVLYQAYGSGLEFYSFW